MFYLELKIFIIFIYYDRWMNLIYFLNFSWKINFQFYLLSHFSAITLNLANSSLPFSLHYKVK